MTDNTEQIAYWNGSAGASWVESYPIIDRLLEPLSSAALDRAAASAGQRVIDVGCGCGSTSIQLAETGAQVRGVDISAAMVEEANQRASKLPNLSFDEADASIETYEASHDLVFSRFGVMFFADPVAAFANIRTALSDRGRLVFLCWQSPMANPWIAIPGQIVQALQPPAEAPDPYAPGPFSLAEEAHLRSVLADAGFGQISVESVDRELTMGADLDETMVFQTRIGPLSTYLAEHDAEEGQQAVNAVRDALAPFESSEGVRMVAAAWLVTASP